MAWKLASLDANLLLAPGVWQELLKDCHGGSSRRCPSVREIPLLWLQGTLVEFEPCSRSDLQRCSTNLGTPLASIQSDDLHVASRRQEVLPTRRCTRGSASLGQPSSAEPARRRLARTRPAAADQDARSLQRCRRRQSRRAARRVR
jgi:hypothetical protein